MNSFDQSGTLIEASSVVAVWEDVADFRYWARLDNGLELAIEQRELVDRSMPAIEILVDGSWGRIDSCRRAAFYLGMAA